MLVSMIYGCERVTLGIDRRDNILVDHVLDRSGLLMRSDGI